MLDTETGMVVPPDQPGLLLDAVQELLADPARQDRFGAAGRRYAHTALSAEQALAELEALVEAAAARVLAPS
jgi:glycosyltransferase involved in cell wall biosynthesis